MPTIQLKDGTGEFQKYTDVNTIKVTGENTNQNNAVEYAGFYRGMRWYMLDSGSATNGYYQCIQVMTVSTAALAPGMFTFFTKEQLTALSEMNPIAIVCCEKGHNVGEWCRLLDFNDSSKNFTWVSDPSNP